MQPLTMVLLESTLTFGVPVGLAITELIHLNRRPPPPPPDRADHTPPPAPGPQTVSMRPIARARVLEDA